MLSRRLLTAAAAATAAAALGAPNAPDATAAAPIYEAEYRVDVDVKATWKYARFEERGTDWQHETDLAATARLTGTIENVLFRNGRLVTANMGLADQKFETTGFMETRVYDNQRHTWISVRDRCDGAHEGGIGMSRLEADPQPGPAPGGGERFVLRVADAAGGTLHCDREDRQVAFERPAAQLGDGLFDTRFHVPAEALGMGKIIQNVAATAPQSSPAYCPGTDDWTYRCEFTWAGTVTFTRTHEEQFPGDLPGAGGAGGGGGGTGTGGPQPLPGPPINAEGLRQAVEAYVNTPKPKPINAEGLTAAVERYVNGDLKLQPGCQTACTGTAALLIGGARKPAATVRFLAKAGQRSVRLKLDPKARRAVRRATTARVVVTTRPAGGGAKTTRTLRLKGR